VIKFVAYMAIPVDFTREKIGLLNAR
jgi:hypothetical protein